MDSAFIEKGEDEDVYSSNLLCKESLQEKMKMCTAATYYAKDHYFGRNLDLEFSYHEEITIVPRSYPFIFRKCEDINHHYAMIVIMQ